MGDRYGVVVIDDHHFIRESIIKSIDWPSMGLEVSGEAQNGLDAQDLVVRTKPDIVITDIKMPGLTGLDLVDKLKVLSPKSRVIVITGFQEFEFAHRAIKQGVVDFVLKPIRNEDLIAAIKKAIQSIESEMNQSAEKIVSGDTAEKTSYGLLVDSILAYIDAHYNEELTLGTLGEIFKIHPGHASRVIAKTTGMSFVQHVNHRRIAAAEKLLLDPSVRIKEIVLACGFSDYGYFLKVFHELVGCSPQQYRARLGSKTG